MQPHTEVLRAGLVCQWPQKHIEVGAMKHNSLFHASPLENESMPKPFSKEQRGPPICGPIFFNLRIHVQHMVIEHGVTDIVS